MLSHVLMAVSLSLGQVAVPDANGSPQRATLGAPVDTPPVMLAPMFPAGSATQATAVPRPPAVYPTLGYSPVYALPQQGDGTLPAPGKDAGKTTAADKKDKNGAENGEKKDKNGDKKEENGDKKDKKDDKSSNAKEEPTGGFLKRFLHTYWNEVKEKEETKDDKKEEEPAAPLRTANPPPFRSPPFPTADWQGYPDIGVPPPDYGNYPLMQGLYGTVFGDFLKDNRIYVYGWVTSSGNYSTSHNSNVPSSYAIVPNQVQLDQAVVYLDRFPDTVQTDHIDWGMRLSAIYGENYRYTTSYGLASYQLLKKNNEYGYDFPMEYAEVFIPNVLQGLMIRAGRYISLPDIEAQLAPDNYLASHSILFTYDNYTQTGILATLKVNNQWMYQAGINAGGDMAPWYRGAIATGFLGVRWISQDNNDSIYTCFNDINNARYRQFDTDGVPSGHDNYNYIVSTWSHRFNPQFITTTEAYVMWEHDAPLGGTPSIGPVEPFGGGGGEGPILPGLSLAYGAVNYTAFQINKQNYVTVRNEWWDDPRGMRTGFATAYSSHTIGIAHNFNSFMQIRPEIGYYHSYNMPAFDNGARSNQVLAMFDFTVRF